MKLTNPKDQAVIESPFATDVDAHQALVKLINEGRASDFAVSIEAAFHGHIEHRLRFSDSQRFWMHKLAMNEPRPARRRFTGQVRRTWRERKYCRCTRPLDEGDGECMTCGYIIR